MDGGGLAGGASDGNSEDSTRYDSARGHPSILWVWRVTLM